MLFLLEFCLVFLGHQPENFQFTGYVVGLTNSVGTRNYFCHELNWFYARQLCLQSKWAPVRESLKVSMCCLSHMQNLATVDLL